MKIIVDGKQAVMKKGSSFEYHSENPLFTEAEDYSFDIEFPMKDCPQNILIFGALHVKGVDISTVSFPCEIITDSFDKNGILNITEVNDSCVKGQFLEGMSSGIAMTDVLGKYLDEIDFSEYDGTSGSQASLDRVGGAGWVNLLVYDSEKEDFYRLREDTVLFGSNAKVWQVQEMRHVYLKTLIGNIGSILNINIDVSVLSSIPMYDSIVVANATYESEYKNSKDYMELEKSLPHWTVREFFENISKFFGCISYIDSASRSIILRTKYESAGSGQKKSLSVLDEFEVELCEEEAGYEGNKRYALPDECNPDNLNMCPWIYEHESSFVKYGIETVESTLKYVAKNSLSTYIPMLNDNVVIDVDNTNRIWGLIYKIEERNDIDPESGVEGKGEKFCRYEVLNQYGDFIDGEELKVVPAPLEMKKMRIGYQFGPNGKESTYLNYSLYYRVPVIKIVEKENVENSNAREVVKEGNKKPNPYDKLYMVLHSGSIERYGYHLNTRRYEVDTATEYDAATIAATEGNVPFYSAGVRLYSYTLSPVDSRIQVNSSLPRVDESKLYRYKFLSKTLPDPKAIYVIKGKEYACLRLTAHFTVDGMSEHIEGEFYEIVG